MCSFQAPPETTVFPFGFSKNVQFSSPTPEIKPLFVSTIALSENSQKHVCDIVALFILLVWDFSLKDTYQNTKTRNNQQKAKHANVKKMTTHTDTFRFHYTRTKKHKNSKLSKIGATLNNPSELQGKQPFC